MLMLSWMPLRAGLEGIHGGRAGDANFPSTCPCPHGCPCAQAFRASMEDALATQTSRPHAHALMDTLVRMYIEGIQWRMAGGGAHPADAARDLVVPIARAHAHARMDARVRMYIGHPWRTRWRRELPSTCPCSHGCPCAHVHRASMEALVAQNSSPSWPCGIRPCRLVAVAGAISVVVARIWSDDRHQMPQRGANVAVKPLEKS